MSERVTAVHASRAREHDAGGRKRETRLTREASERQATTGSRRCILLPEHSQHYIRIQAIAFLVSSLAFPTAALISLPRSLVYSSQVHVTWMSDRSFARSVSEAGVRHGKRGRSQAGEAGETRYSFSVGETARERRRQALFLC